MQDARTDDDAMSTATALGLSGDIAPHVGYASSHSSESGLKGRPGSPDSPLLWAGVPIACSLIDLSLSAAVPSSRPKCLPPADPWQTCDMCFVALQSCRVCLV